MPITLDRLLECVGSTEATTFKELCDALGDDCPRTGNTPEWAELFRAVHEAEDQQLVDTEWKNGKLAAIQLTMTGADRVRALLDAKRGLFRALPQDSYTVEDD